MQSLIEFLSLKRAMRKTTLSFAMWLGALLPGVSGCGNSLYALRANAASAKLEEAREAGAEQLAPYQYTLAKEHLTQARVEAAEADYGDAYDLANAAADYADQAIERCAQLAAKAPAAKETTQ